ncbi:MAG: GNAT family N-acetyltransferase [Endozoicomonas sp.]
MIGVEKLDSIALPLVNRFYRENGHKGKARSNERVFVLRDRGRILAALRACPKADGYLLRSVWVAVTSRKQGYGSILLQQSLSQLGNSQCWCYPYSHLKLFYQLSGFQEVIPEQAPEEIALPWQSYRGKGENFLLMGYSPNQKKTAPNTPEARINNTG